MMRKTSSKVKFSPLTVAVVVATMVLLYLILNPNAFRPSSTATMVQDSQQGGAQVHLGKDPAEVHDNLLADMFALDIRAKSIELERFSRKMVLVVNVASHCGFTELNYRELQDLYEHHRDRLEILAFPCNQFGNQESGTNKEIETFSRHTKKAQFQMFSKIDVNGPQAHPLYKRLKTAMNVTDIEWNFGKFLLSRGGKPLRYYDHRFPFEVIKRHIANLVLLEHQK